MKKEMTYTVAYQELSTIVKEMELSEISIDELDSKIKRASTLLSICKDKLYKTEQNVQKVLDEINNYTTE